MASRFRAIDIARRTRTSSMGFFWSVIFPLIKDIVGVPQEELEPVLLVECPRFLFPFARRVIADVTSDGGFPPFMLDPIDFAGVYAARKAQADGATQVGNA